MSQLILDYLSLERIRVPLYGETKDDIIGEMAAMLQDERHDAATLEKAILAREKISSTGIGHGVALPHCRLDISDRSRLAVGITALDVDWQSLDGLPVRLVFAIVGSKKDPAEVVALLGEISRLLHSPALREWLKGAESAREVYDLLRAHV